MNDKAKIIMWLGLMMILFTVIREWTVIRQTLFTGSGSVFGSAASNPAGKNTNILGESKTGACPPGFPPGIVCLGA
jgi:hypothetical protein